MITLTVTPPNTCGLGLFPSGLILYIPEAGGATLAPDGTTLEEFLTPEEALARALEIDPSYNPNNILGPLQVFLSAAYENPVVGYLSQSVTIDSESVCSDPSATLTYAWQSPFGNLGVTSPSITMENLSESYNGTYTCSVSAVNPQGQTGEATFEFNLTVVPAPTPSGVINTGRSGLGELDLAPSYFTTLQNMPAGVTETQLELYVPGTDTVIPYNPELPPPFKFDSLGNCFTPGDYRLVIRVAATSQVLATVYPPSGANQNILWLYNPVVPAAPAGSGGSIAE